jgi:hypothetical protein
MYPYRDIVSLLTLHVNVLEPSPYTYKRNFSQQFTTSEMMLLLHMLHTTI